MDALKCELIAAAADGITQYLRTTRGCNMFPHATATFAVGQRLLVESGRIVVSGPREGSREHEFILSITSKRGGQHRTKR